MIDFDNYELPADRTHREMQNLVHRRIEYIKSIITDYDIDMFSQPQAPVDIAEFLGCSKSTLHKAIHRGDLEVKNTGLLVMAEGCNYFWMHEFLYKKIGRSLKVDKLFFTLVQVGIR